MSNNVTTAMNDRELGRRRPAGRARSDTMTSRAQREFSFSGRNTVMFII